MRRNFPEGRRVATPAHWWLFAASACLLAGAPLACRQSRGSADAANGVSVREEITPLPVRVGEATVAVQLADASANPLTHAAIMVEADMAHPGMAPVFAAANEITPGSYEGKINFSMGGDWVLLLHITLANGARIERQMDVRGVRSN